MRRAGEPIRIEGLVDLAQPKYPDSRFCAGLGLIPGFEPVRRAGEPVGIEGPTDGPQLLGVGKPVDGALPRAVVDGRTRDIRDRHAASRTRG